MADPGDMLFGTQLGGGMGINKSAAYCEQVITDASQTLFLLIAVTLIADLFEGGNEAQLVRRIQIARESSP